MKFKVIGPLDARLLKSWAPHMAFQLPVNLDVLKESMIYEEPKLEDFIPTIKQPRVGFELFPARGSAWVANLLLSLMIFSSVFQWSKYIPNKEIFVASKESVFHQGEYWRLLTALVGHGDFMHLAHNAPIFWFFCWILTAYFGWIFALVASLLIGVFSNLITVWFYESSTMLLGASGMVYGMVALWLVLYIRFDRSGWWVKRAVRSFGFSLLVLFPQTYEPNVSYLAHASGFLLGVLFGILLIPLAKNVAPVLNESYYLPKL
jgi:membrane associated rhomboid family serine protease